MTFMFNRNRHFSSQRLCPFVFQLRGRSGVADGTQPLESVAVSDEDFLEPVFGLLVFFFSSPQLLVSFFFVLLPLLLFGVQPLLKRASVLLPLLPLLLQLPESLRLLSQFSLAQRNQKIWW